MSGAMTLRILPVDLADAAQAAAWLDLLDALEHFHWHLLDQLLEHEAVAFFRGDAHIALFAGAHAQQRIFQAGDDVAGALQVGQRVGIGGARGRRTAKRHGKR